MSNKVIWIKTGLRGARAEFTDSDLFTTLLLIANEPMGRYRLQKELALSESSTKSLLNYCKSMKLLQTSAGRKGHSLDNLGEKIVNRLMEFIITYGILDMEISDEKNHFFVVFSLNKKVQLDFSPSSWEIRDIAVAYGAKSILFLYIDDENKINFPERELKINKYYPNLQQKINDTIKSNLKKDNRILITSANSIEVARKSAIATVTSIVKLFIEDILNFK